MAGKMRIRASSKDGVTTVKVLMSHPMETGLRKGPDGKPVPKKHITDVMVTLNDKTVLQAFWGGSVSQNPFMEFSFEGGAPGDKLKVEWKDTDNETQAEEIALK